MARTVTDPLYSQLYKVRGKLVGKQHVVCVSVGVENSHNFTFIAFVRKGYFDKQRVPRGIFLLTTKVRCVQVKADGWS